MDNMEGFYRYSKRWWSLSAVLSDVVYVGDIHIEKDILKLRSIA